MIGLFCFCETVLILTLWFGPLDFFGKMTVVGFVFTIACLHSATHAILAAIRGPQTTTAGHRGAERQGVTQHTGGAE